jgi:hypothetical protein
VIKRDKIEVISWSKRYKESYMRWVLEIVLRLQQIQVAENYKIY